MTIEHQGFVEPGVRLLEMTATETDSLVGQFTVAFNLTIYERKHTIEVVSHPFVYGLLQSESYTGKTPQSCLHPRVGVGPWKFRPHG